MLIAYDCFLQARPACLWCFHWEAGRRQKQQMKKEFNSIQRMGNLSQLQPSVKGIITLEKQLVHLQFLFVFMTDGFTKTGYSQLSVIVQSPFITVLFSSYVCRKLLRVRIQDKHLFTKLSRRPRKQGCSVWNQTSKSATHLSACYMFSEEFFSGREEQVVG